MAQGDLYKLLEEVSFALAKDMDAKGGSSERFRERTSRVPHDVYISRDEVRDELLIQLQDFMLSDQMGVQQGVRQVYGARSGRSRSDSVDAVKSLAHTGGLTKSQIKVVEEQADQFVKSALRAVTDRQPRGIVITKISGDDKNFVLRFTPTLKNANVYDAVNRVIFKPAKSRIANQLARKGFQLDKAKEARIFNLGTVSAVSDLTAERAMSKLQRGLKRARRDFSDPLAKDASDALKLKMISKFSRVASNEFSKDYTVEAAIIRVRSQASNMTDLDYEAAVMRDVKKSLKNSMSALPIDWASQRDSVMDAVAAEVFGTARRKHKNSSAVRYSGPNEWRIPTGRQNTKDITVNSKKKKIPTKKLGTSDFDLGMPDGIGVPPSYLSLRALIPILNERLPEVIRSHMGQKGRLVNRTGRFSESATIVTADNASMTIGYTYMTSPYSVFEPDKFRDPRPLIEMSIREIARELTLERFNLRRI